MTVPPLNLAGLRCGHHANPLGISPDRIRFGWVLEGSGHDRRQCAYQLHVALSEDRLESGRELAWDTGRVESSRTVDVGYAGPALDRGTRYVWRVRAWDERDAVSAWSDTASFEIELDRVVGWHASWIGLGKVREQFAPPSGVRDPVVEALSPVPCLRREFVVDRPVASARLYVTALGIYETRLNGRRVGDSVLTPGWTDYARRIHYQTYDVTGLLREGANVLGSLIADGWYSGFYAFDAKRAGAHYGTFPELLAELVITSADGTRQRVVTDGSWRGQFGAVRYADLLMGEAHNLEAEPHGWERPGFDVTAWRAVRCRDRDGTPLIAEPGPPITVAEDITARTVTRDGSGRHIVDFGQNLTGWLRLAVDAAETATVTIRHAEVLAPDGGLYTENLRTARQTDTFLNVRGPLVLEPKFTIHGFRFAEISGYPGRLDRSSAVARVAHSAIAPTGSFESSQPWLNRLFANIDWGQRGNFISVPTDCPQRDERLGWLGDAQVFARTACYNRDVAAFLDKWLDDVADAQFPSGAYSDIAPRLHLEWAGAPAWADAGVIVPWTVYRMYGDRGCLERHYDAMTAWMEFIARDNPGYLRIHQVGNRYNDWLAPGEDDTSRELLATAYWAYDAAIMAEVSDAIGRPEPAARFRALRSKIAAAFADAFIRPDGRLASDTQTAYALGLHMGLVPPELEEAAAAHLVEAIARADWHVTTGFVGVGYLLPVLCAHGYTDVAYRLLEQPSAPSWRYMVDHDATTIWERWDGWTRERGFQSAAMNSFNHYALGSVGEWLYRFVLGIELAPGATGFDRVVIRPYPGGQLTWAEGSFRSVRGPIVTSWRRDADVTTVRVELPPNVSGSVHIASGDAAAVRASGGRGPDRLGPFPGTAGLLEAVFDVGSGVHEFVGPTVGVNGLADVAADPGSAAR